MNTMQIDILNPKAIKLINDLADLNLISIRKENNFSKILKSLRSNNQNVPSFEEITKEVELVRKKSILNK